jgi:hypothetical protein
MLFYKAWIETRVRFFAGLAAATIVCVFNIQQHAWLVKWWAQELADPRGYHLAWMTLGVHDYGWYLWHYLYNNYLQQVWALFAMLFAFGGLIREKSSGSVLFSLSLPVSRRQWLFSRLVLAFVESIALALFAVAVVIVGSSAIHQSYSLAQILLHTALMVGAGVFLIAFGNLCYSLFPGDYLSLLITLVLLGVPYLILQTYMQHLSYFGKTSWFAYLDFAHTMAGPWQLSWSTVPWIALITSWALTAFCWRLAVAHGDRIDY